MSGEQLCVISGATGGIGRVVTETLWRAGYSVVALGRNREKLAALAQHLVTTHQGDQVAYLYVCDVTDAHFALAAPAICVDGGVRRVYTSVVNILDDFYNNIALLVTCHGAAPTPGPAITAGKALRSVYETDVLGTFALCQLVSAYMLHRHHGSIVLLSSIHARQTYPERTAYCVAKSAVCGLARGLAVEWGQRGLSVNAILPWQVRGERSQHFAETLRQETGEDLYELYKQRSPQRRLVEPQEIANTVLWLAQNPSVNGQEIVLDGGVSSSMWFRPFLEETS